MAKYVLKYLFDYGAGVCLWSVNDLAKRKFNYPIENCELPISKSLGEEIDRLIVEYDTSLNWDYPPDPSPWTTEQRNDFKYRANIAYQKLLLELGDEFEILNEIDRCV